MIATSTIAQSYGIVARAFSGLVVAAAGDATALFNVVYGIDDGRDYGRYFAGQNPLQAYSASASSLGALISRGVTLKAAVESAASAFIRVGDTAIPGYGGAADLLTESLRQACADPRDAIRLFSRLCGFQLVRRRIGVPADALGLQLYVNASRAVLRCRLAAARSLIMATADYQPTSQEDAQTVRDDVCAILAALAWKCRDLYQDATAEALEDAQAAISIDLTKRGADLAPIVTETMPMNFPAVVLASRFYDDPAREGDLLARSDPPHPGFMPTIFERLAS